MTVDVRQQFEKRTAPPLIGTVVCADTRNRQKVKLGIQDMMKRNAYYKDANPKLQARIAEMESELAVLLYGTGEGQWS